MVPGLTWALTAGALALAAAVGVVTWRDRPIGWWILGGLVAYELALVAQLVVGIVLLARGQPGVSAAPFVGYLVGLLLVLPAGTAWALGERSRWGTGVLAIACLVVPVLLLRLTHLWSGRA